MVSGAVALLDVLGWKGIWVRKEDAIGDLLAVTKAVEAKAAKSRRLSKSKRPGLWSEYNDLKSDLLLLSDTIALTVQGDERRAIELATLIVASLIAHGLERSLPMRGAISAGKFYSKGNVFVGPAIDEVAAWYEQTDWIGAILTPSADLVIDKHGPKFNAPHLLYSAPVKGIQKQTFYCVDWTFHEVTDGPFRFFGRNKLADQLRALAPIVPEVASKIRNTMDFYDVLMLKPNPKEQAILDQFKK